MTVDNLAITARQHGDLEAEFTDAGTHPIHDCIVLPRVPGVVNHALNRPNLDIHSPF